MINYLFIFISVLSPLVPMYICKSNYKTFNLQLRVLFLLVSISFTVDILSFAFLFLGFNSILFFNIYTIVKLVLAAFIIIRASKSFNKYPFRLNFYLTIVITGISIIANFYQDGIQHSNVISNLLSGIFIIYLSIQWFLFLLIDMTVKSLNEYYMFWIISGFLISSSLSLFVSISEDYIRLNEDNSAYLLWIINLIANILFNFFIANGFFKYLKN